MKRGFTLIEVLAALAILGTSLFALVLTRNAQMDRIERTLDRAAARELALQRLAEVMADLEQADTMTFDERTVDEGYTVRTTLQRAWIDGVAANLVTVDVERADAPGKPLGSYSICLADKPAPNEESQTP